MIEGFEVPLYRSLTEPVLLAGAPRSVAVVNGTIAAALGLGLQLWLAGLILCSSFLLAFEARLAKTDAMLLLTVVAAMGAMAKVYLAWQRVEDLQHPRWIYPAVFWTALAGGRTAISRGQFTAARKGAASASRFMPAWNAASSPV